MALQTAHTRANQERPPATPVADPEKIIRKGRALKRKISRAVRTTDQIVGRGRRKPSPAAKVDLQRLLFP